MLMLRNKNAMEIQLLTQVKNHHEKSLNSKYKSREPYKIGFAGFFLPLDYKMLVNKTNINYFILSSHS
jgi:hypothetical protein